MGILNHLLSHLWLFVFMGIVHILIIEHRVIFYFVREKSKKITQLMPIFYRLPYIFLGLLLIFFSYAIVNYSIFILIPDSIPTVDYSNLPVNDFWSFVKHQEQYGGMIFVIGLYMAGISLILSGGGRWLVNLSKLLITLSYVCLVFLAFVVYS